MIEKIWKWGKERIREIEEMGNEIEDLEVEGIGKKMKLI